MTMKNAYNITDRFTGSVIFTAEIQVADDAPMALRLGAATAVAIAAQADLRGANLRYADLRYADLSYADLRYADLSYADLHRIATELAAENKRLRDTLSMLVSMSDNHSPFGGEIYQDRVDRAWDSARAALKDGAT